MCKLLALQDDVATALWRTCFRRSMSVQIHCIVLHSIRFPGQEYQHVGLWRGVFLPLWALFADKWRNNCDSSSDSSRDYICSQAHPAERPNGIRKKSNCYYLYQMRSIHNADFSFSYPLEPSSLLVPKLLPASYVKNRCLVTERKW